MTTPGNSSAKRITVQIPTAPGDMIEAWVYHPRAAAPSRRRDGPRNPRMKAKPYGALTTMVTAPRRAPMT
jgi:hypothetical protein